MATGAGKEAAAMAPSSSLHALALVPPALHSARRSGFTAPASPARVLPKRRVGAVVLAAALPSDVQWLERLPEKKKPLYTHSLPCIEAWLRSLGLTQSARTLPSGSPRSRSGTRASASTSPTSTSGWVVEMEIRRSTEDILECMAT